MTTRRSCFQTTPCVERHIRRSVFGAPSKKDNYGGREGSGRSGLGRSKKPLRPLKRPTRLFEGRFGQVKGRSGPAKAASAFSLGRSGLRKSASAKERLLIICFGLIEILYYNVLCNCMVIIFYYNDQPA